MITFAMYLCVYVRMSVCLYACAHVCVCVEQAITTTQELAPPPEASPLYVYMCARVCVCMLQDLSSHDPYQVGILNKATFTLVGVGSELVQSRLTIVVCVCARAWSSYVAVCNSYGLQCKRCNRII